MPKVSPGKDADDTDLQYPDGSEDLQTCLDRCAEHLTDLPRPIDRSWVGGGSSVSQDQHPSQLSPETADGEKIRILQWNVLSQGDSHSLKDCPISGLSREGLTQADIDQGHRKEYVHSSWSFAARSCIDVRVNPRLHCHQHRVWHLLHDLSRCK